MKILTKQPVYVNKKRVTTSDFYMSFDATGKPENEKEWKMFQVWHNKKGYTPALTEDGKVTDATNQAWGKYSSGFISDVKAVAGFTATITGSDPTPEQKAEMNKKGYDWDKTKGWIDVSTKAGKESGFFDALFNKAGLTTPPNLATTPGVPVVAGKTQAEIDAEEKKKKQRRTLIIVGSIAAVAVIAMLVFIRKKSETAKD
jgi:hypothetical protein